MANQGLCIINWLELPRDVTAKILQKTGLFNILMNVSLVCKYWHSISEEPSFWTRINVTDMDLMACYCKHEDYNQATKEIEAIIRLAVDRSRGGLVDLNLDQFSTVELIRFVTDRCTKIRRFRAVERVNDEKILCELISRLPLLEDLDMVCGNYSSVTLETIGRSCPRLTCLKWNRTTSSAWRHRSNQDARSIASTMPQLRRLQLIGNSLTNKGVRAILDACPNLESLDLRGAYYVRLKTDIRERCARWIDNLRGPFDRRDEDFDVPHYDPNDYTWLKDLGDERHHVDDDAITIESFDSKFFGMQVGGDGNDHIGLDYSDTDTDRDRDSDNDLNRDDSD